MAEFVLGFKTLADLIPDIVGEPLEDEHHNPENGDGLQATTKGLLVWRKADNWTAFTDGYRTWINGPQGLQTRLNSERFDWEKQATVQLIWATNPSPSYRFLVSCPRGFILHGSRSGRDWSIEEEFKSTIGYAQTGANGLGWNYTAGDGKLAVHILPGLWGWNARTASMYYIAIEIAQPTAAYDVTDGEVDAIVEAVRLSRNRWEHIPLHFVTHAELEHNGETGTVDGKTDVFEYGDPRADELRSRIAAELTRVGIV